MNKEQEELLNEVYRKYADSHEYFVDGWLHIIPMEHSKETFVNECKTNTEFSERWGFEIEERELSTDERNKWFQINLNGNNPLMKSDWKDYELDQQNIPTKLITITYNDKTIESYEMDGKLCYCGNPVDTSNPDCVTFNLCREHQMDV